VDLETDLPVRAQPDDMGTAFLQMIAAASRDPQVDVEKMQKLLEMRERLLAKEAETAFNVSMRAAQSEIGPVFRDAENPHTKSRYAKLEAIDAKIRPVYVRHGFSLTFNSAPPAKEGAARILCDVLHSGGHSKHYELEGELDVAGAKGTSNKTSIQGLGSSVSYLRRYLTLMIFNLVMSNEDDDGMGVGRGTGAGVLSLDQATHIHDLMTECKMDADSQRKFYAFIGSDAANVEQIRIGDYDRAVQALRKKLNKVAPK